LFKTPAGNHLLTTLIGTFDEKTDEASPRELVRLFFMLFFQLAPKPSSGPRKLLLHQSPLFLTAGRKVAGCNGSSCRPSSSSMKAQKEKRSSATFSEVGNDQKNREEDNEKGMFHRRSTPE
jgi:hypothetical protein